VLIPTTVREFTLIYLNDFSNVYFLWYGIKITNKVQGLLSGGTKLLQGAGGIAQDSRHKT
jgi:hypothetical protein